MADRTPPTARQDGDRMVLSVAEAAAHLGVTPDAVRARLHRGTLFGVKDAGEWRVYLDRPATDRQDTDSPDPVGRQDTRQDATGKQQDTDRHTDRHTDRLPTETVLAVYERLVESQREEIAFLRSELETRTDELQRRDVLLREALGRIPQLGAGGDALNKSGQIQGEAIATETGTETLRESARPGAPGEATERAETHETEHRESIIGSVWRRLFGRG